jgi:hypothetical protein
MVKLKTITKVFIFIFIILIGVYSYFAFFQGSVTGEFSRTGSTMSFQAPHMDVRKINNQIEHILNVILMLVLVLDMSMMIVEFVILMVKIVVMVIVVIVNGLNVNVKEKQFLRKKLSMVDLSGKKLIIDLGLNGNYFMMMN